jgi:YggT family protein
MTAAAIILSATRILVLVIFVIGSLVAVTHWAVKHGHLSPFGPWANTVRRLAQPFIRALERALLRSGGNPVNAPYALFLVALVGGLALLALVRWGVFTAFAFAASASAGPRAVFVFLVDWAFTILMVAILIRAVASWFGISPYSKPMRVVYRLTDWLIEPLRKVIPPLGMFDVTPIVAYFILYLIRMLLLGWL